MNAAAPIDPRPGLGVVAAVALYAVFDPLLPTRGLTRDNGAKPQTDYCTCRGRTGITASAPYTAAPLHLLHQGIPTGLLREEFRNACQRRSQTWDRSGNE